MKRLILVALAATALASPAFARDWWNGSGFSLDHQYHSPYDNIFGRGGSGQGFGSGYVGQPNARIVHVPEGATDRQELDVSEGASQRALRVEQERAMAKAVQDQHECKPVVLYTDEGRVVHPAQGCR